jgi:hypothetical protein
VTQVFDRVWSYATLYENPDNSVLQELALVGRLQVDFAVYDANQGNYDDAQMRRFRAGARSRWLSDFTLHADGTQSDLLGFTLVPFYHLTRTVQVVARYTHLSSSGRDGIRFSRYDDRIDSKRGGQYDEGFVGLDWFVYGDALKLDGAQVHGHA